MPAEFAHDDIRFQNSISFTLSKKYIYFIILINYGSIKLNVVSVCRLLLRLSKL